MGFGAASFNSVAEIYDEIRPSYPDELVENVISLSKIDEHGKILEIGCGTGQATLLFARRGFEILCIEPGLSLAAVAKKK